MRDSRDDECWFWLAVSHYPHISRRQNFAKNCRLIREYVRYCLLYQGRMVIISIVAAADDLHKLSDDWTQIINYCDNDVSQSSVPEVTGLLLRCWLRWQELGKTSEEYSRLVDYVKNTHAATHQQYQLEILDVSYVYRCRRFRIWIRRKSNTFPKSLICLKSNHVGFILFVSVQRYNFCK